MHRLLHLFLSMILAFSICPAQATGIKNKNRLPNDATITARITAQFAEKPTLTPSKVSILTQKGVVKLSGEVKDKQTLIEAFWLARTTRGVKRVDIDDLEIKHVNTTLSDAYITAKIETAVLKAKILDDESIPLVGINATTANGIVTLTGEVKKDKSITAILKRANAVRGVKKIISSLHVQGVKAS